MKLTAIDWPIAIIPSPITASAVAREQMLSTRLDITPPCSSPNGWRSSSRISHPDPGVVGIVVEPLGPDQRGRSGRAARAGPRPSGRTLSGRIKLSRPLRRRPSAPLPVGLRRMALSDDQKAMLRLLAQREQGYDDIAALMGLSVEEVRAKVDGRAGPARGRRQARRRRRPAPPGAAADAEEPRPTDPVTPEEPLARSPRAGRAAGCRPSLPRRVPPRANALRPPGPRLSLPSEQRRPRGDRRRRPVVLVVLVVVLIVSGGGGDSTRPPPAPATARSHRRNSGERRHRTEARKPTQAVLEPVGGASGRASRSSAGSRTRSPCRSKPTASNRPPRASPTPSGWRSRRRRCCRWPRPRSARTARIGAQFEVPTEVLAYLAKRDLRPDRRHAAPPTRP